MCLTVQKPQSALCQFRKKAENPLDQAKPVHTCAHQPFWHVNKGSCWPATTVCAVQGPALRQSDEVRLALHIAWPFFVCETVLTAACLLCHPTDTANPYMKIWI